MEGKREEKKPKEEADITKCEAERQEYLDGWRRAKADLINFRAEAEVKMKEDIKFANEDLIRSILPVLLSFDLSLKSLPGESAEARGVRQLRDQLWSVLQRHGVEEITVSVGDPFDPGVHEAVSISVETRTNKGGTVSGKEDTIFEIIEFGYRLNGKVIRPVRVIVGDANI